MKDEALKIRLTREQFTAIRAAAARAGIPMSAWAVERLLGAARQEAANDRGGVGNFVADAATVAREAGGGIDEIARKSVASGTHLVLTAGGSVTAAGGKVSEEHATLARQAADPDVTGVVAQQVFEVLGRACMDCFEPDAALRKIDRDLPATPTNLQVLCDDCYDFTARDYRTDEQKAQLAALDEANRGRTFIP